MVDLSPAISQSVPGAARAHWFPCLPPGHSALAHTQCTELKHISVFSINFLVDFDLVFQLICVFVYFKDFSATIMSV